MARTVIEQLTDDLDGSKAEATLTFAVDGTHYEIELSKRNRSAFDKAIAPYLAAARKVRGPAPTASTTRRTSGGGKRTDRNDIREWARSAGYEVSERGRIAGTIVEAYDAAH